MEPVEVAGQDFDRATKAITGKDQAGDQDIRKA
jgi:hypothetical protein